MWARLTSLTKRPKQPGWLAVAANESQVDYVHAFPSALGGPTFGLAGSRSLGAGNTFERVARELRFETFHCTTTLQPGEYQVLMVDGVNVPDEELKGALRWRVKDMLDYPVENATIDALAIPGDEATQKVKGRSLFAVAARNEAVKSCMQRFEQARVPLGVIDIAEAAQRNIAALFETGNRAVALLYLAADWGLLTVNNRRELMMARRLEVGYALLADEASIENPVERLALELQRSFDHFERQFSGLSIEKLLIAPMPVPGSVASRLSGNLGLPVVDLDLATVATLEGELASPEAQWRLFHLLGAALRDEKQPSGDPMAQQINLINPAFRSKKQPFAALAMAQALGAVFAGGLALYGYAIYQAAMLRPAAAQTERQLVERRSQLAELSRTLSPQGTSKLLEEEVARVESRLASRRAVLGDLTSGVSAGDGFGQYLSGLARQRVEGVWLTKVAVHASSGEVVLEGRALSAERVPAYLGQLRRETVFAGRIVAELKITAREIPPEARATLPPGAPAAFVEFGMSLPRSGAQASTAGMRDSGSGKPL